MAKVFLSTVIVLGVAGSALAFAGSGTLEISVRDLSGKPIAEATVYAIYSERIRGRTPRFRSDAEGNLVLRDLPLGSYEVHAFKESEGYADTFFAFFGIDSNGKAFQVVNVQERGTINIVLTLGPKCARLKLSIKNEQGKPVEAGLTFTRVNAPQPTITLGANAESELLVPPVPFRLEVSATGYQPWHSGILNPPSGGTFEVTVRLKRSP